jgi:formate-nitrite transporter family protein
MPRLGEQKRDDGPLKSYKTILTQELDQAEEEIHRPIRGLLLSGIIAGFTVGVGPLLAAYVLSTGDAGGPSLLRLISAAVYSTGFILVVMARTDLFTEFTTIAILPVLGGQATVRALARLWVLVLLGNWIGAVAFALVAVAVASPLAGIDVAVHARIAAQLAHAPLGVVLVSSALAGWLMGVLSWLVTAARDTISQVAFVWIIGVVIHLLHLHHSITGTIDVLIGSLMAPTVGAGDVGYFMVWTVAGNAAGGILFAVIIRVSLVLPAQRQGDAG